MASYNTVITNEGAALLASVIGNQGTLTFSEMRFSTTDYAGLEQTLTVGTFAGTFVTAAASGSIIDTTTIKVASQFDNSAIVGDHPLYSIGIVGTDGNTTALIAVCTTSTPDVIRTPIPATSISTYAFNVNLTVASTQNITVTGTTAAVLYDVDVVNVLTSTATDKPLSANMGRTLNEQSSAVTNVYGAKNLFDFDDYLNWVKTKYPALTWTKNNGEYVISDINPLLASGAYTFSDADIDVTLTIQTKSNALASNTVFPTLYNSNNEQVAVEAININNSTFTNGTLTGHGSKILFGYASGDGMTFKNPMLRDARITDDTFVPFAKTNLQLTEDVSSLSNENLLLNPWFTVNQRNATTITSGYGADMWNVNGGTSITFSSSGATLTTAQMGQKLEDLPNGLYTLSVLLSNGTIYNGSFNKQDNVTDFAIISNNDIYCGYSAATKNIWFSNTTGTSPLTIRAVKLEIGSKSTLAHDVAPNYTTELLKCQRYLAPVGYCTVIKNSSGAYSGIVHLSVPMRDAPTIPLPTLSNALWAPGLGTFTPDTVSLQIQDTYVNSNVSVIFTGASLTEDSYIFDNRVLASAEL